MKHWVNIKKKTHEGKLFIHVQKTTKQRYMFFYIKATLLYLTPAWDLIRNNDNLKYKKKFKEK